MKKSIALAMSVLASGVGFTALSSTSGAATDDTRPMYLHITTPKPTKGECVKEVKAFVDLAIKNGATNITTIATDDVGCNADDTGWDAIVKYDGSKAVTSGDQKTTHGINPFELNKSDAIYLSKLWSTTYTHSYPFSSEAQCNASFNGVANKIKTADAAGKVSMTPVGPNPTRTPYETSYGCTKDVPGLNDPRGTYRYSVVYQQPRNVPSIYGWEKTESRPGFGNYYMEDGKIKYLDGPSEIFGHTDANGIWKMDSTRA